MKRLGRWLGYGMAIYAVATTTIIRFSDPTLTETQLFQIAWPFSLVVLLGVLIVLLCTEDRVRRR